MTSRPIFVAGDVVIDCLLTTLASPAISPAVPANWQQYGRLGITSRPGGALLIAELVRSGARMLGQTLLVISHTLEDGAGFSTDQIIRTFLHVQRSTDGRFRVKEFGGFCGVPVPTILPYDDDPADVALIVINDAGNNFRESSVWPKCITEGTAPILLKLGSPFRSGPLWGIMQSNHIDRVTAVINADDLRNAGVYISKGISWDRTAADCVVGMSHNELVRDLLKFSNVLIRFGLDGVLHYRRDHRDKVRIFYDPDRAEGEYAAAFGQYSMSGFGATFCASLALDTDNSVDLDLAISQALVSTRRLLDSGFGDNETAVTIQTQEVFDRQYDASGRFAISHVPFDSKRISATSWSFLRQIVGDELPELARTIVLRGEIPPLQFGVPLAKFGNLETLDRSEAESYRSIRNLFREFLSLRTPLRPLSIAVFGQPGAGKSFGVTEIAESLNSDVIKKGPSFNLAQFTSVRDLVDAFHRIRDISLSGNVPLVFFDEFDCRFEDRQLGWLKYFLAPMQDGLFIDAGALHPIGRAIFVFAGGTSHTFEDFCAQPSSSNEMDSGKLTKVPDFVSRLRGYINIVGLDPVGPGDGTSIVRRAVVLRSLLTRKYPELVGQQGIAEMDEGVLHAFLYISKYKHGVRSMEALLDMSMLSGKRRFARAALPALDQIEMHVEADEFIKLVVSH